MKMPKKRTANANTQWRGEKMGTTIVKLDLIVPFKLKHKKYFNFAIYQTFLGKTIFN